MPDNLTRNVLAACFAVFLAVIGIGSALGSSGCTKNSRRDTISAMLVTVNASRDAFTAWDLAHQRAILASTDDRAAYNAKIAKYRDGAQAKVIAGFVLAYQLIADAATKTDSLSFDKARSASGKLIDDVRDVMGAGPDAPEPIIVIPEPGAPGSPRSDAGVP